ncbi:hypothetical protein ONZ43_g6949 [Nemania bipapillata]|uniref:Uncharacterized protein n=1 Tax=Nemania bipapillata TaxID=110536 RepID=A0ACC2HVK5_9PEZI|nr:hypothetical protein ONZ43_g6949 [Nemania bipapillata]
MSVLIQSSRSDIQSTSVGDSDTLQQSKAEPVNIHNFAALDGFPTQLSGPGVWTGSVFTEPEQYIQQLDTVDLQDIDNALRHFQNTGLAHHDMRREHFPLSSNLSGKLQHISEIVHSDRFFVVLRGLNPDKYTEMENVIIYGGLASHVGDERADMIHLYDRAKGNQSPESRALFPPNEITIPMDFHTDVDAGDMLSLYTLGLPKQGGDQYLASFWTIYNELAEKEPEVLATLASDWRYEMKRQNGVEIINRPVMTCVDGKVQINFATAFLIGSAYIPRLPESPSISSAQQKAIDSLLRLSRQHCLKLDHAKGDMLFANNMSLVHARDNFIDDPAAGEVRHLLSVMLRDGQRAWPKDASVANMIDQKFAGLDSQFFGTMDQYEVFRGKFAMLRHD